MNDGELGDVTIQALGSAYYASCKDVLFFVGEFVAPKVDEKTSLAIPGHGRARSPLFFRLACFAMVTRLHAWLLTLSKLSSPADFQAVAAGSRALFEMAVDLTLIMFEESKSMGKLQAWHFASKLRVAEGLVKDSWSTEQKAELEWLKRTVTELRAQHWGTQKWRSRWTGRHLDRDAVKADGFRQTGFATYYAEHYAVVCWNVHGSGVSSMLDAPEEVIPYVATRGFHDAGKFAVASAKLLLELLSVYDQDAEERFKRLQNVMARTQFDTLQVHKKLAAEKQEGP